MSDDRLPVHNLMRLELECVEILRSFHPNGPNERTEMLEQITVRDHANQLAFINDKEVVEFGLLEHVSNPLKRIVHVDGNNGLGHDVAELHGLTSVVSHPLPSTRLGKECETQESAAIIG